MKHFDYLQVTMLWKVLYKLKLSKFDTGWDFCIKLRRVARGLTASRGKNEYS